MVFRFPGDPWHSYMKRVVGLSGETVEMRKGSRVLRHGENARRKAASHTHGRAGVGGAQHVHGEVPSYNNLTDADAWSQLSVEFDRPAAATVRHTIPGGCAEGTILAMGHLKAPG